MRWTASRNGVAVETQRLTKIYASGNTRVFALRDANIKVRRGEVIALLGPSGSGKSTFLAAVGLINPPTAGRIFIDGQLVMDGPRSVANLHRYRLRQIGYVFPKANLIAFLTARENVQLVMELRGSSASAARRRAMDLLDYLGVADRANHMPSMLSSGQQQRVAIARALANRPSVVLADEPTAALDKHLGRQVMELFRMLAHEQNSGVIVVTHDHRSLDVFDTIYEMEDGVITRHLEAIPYATT
ncbi:MAG TPA: ABC transporter ATP-binding protein [Lacipirellulaceae bacterium]